MIRLKLSFGDNKPDKTFDIDSGELLHIAVSRAIAGVPLADKTAGEVFNVIVNGNFIEPGLWEFTKLSPSDTVLITLNMASGESGQIFKQFALIAITVVASVYLGPEAGAQGAALIGGSLQVAAVTIGAALLLNALIPPPVPNSVGFGSGGYEGSQAFSITGQSNSSKPYSVVPRVYGQHRMFPNLAASPYTELAVDPRTGEQIQYLYAIYDFGLGPVDVQQIKIGDTVLDPDNFNDYAYRLVDFNKPVVSEGLWDDALSSALTLYKGDVNADYLSAGLPGNQDDGDPESEWRVVRTTGVNPSGLDQEIVLQFACQEGLYGYSSSGQLGERRINMDIEYSVSGANDWKKYNDPTVSKDFDSVGGQIGIFEIYVNFAKVDNLVTPDAYYDVYFVGGSGGDLKAHYVKYLKPGNKLLLVKDPTTPFVVGQPLYFFGAFRGNIAAINSYINPAFAEIIMDRPVPGNSVQFPIYTSYTPFVTFNLVAEPVKVITNSLGVFRIEGSKKSTVYGMVRFTPIASGQFDVRVTRKNTSGTYSSVVADNLTWGNLTTRIDRAPIITDKRHVFLELKIKATSQLNGTIQNLSGLVRSVCDVYDDGTMTWSKQITSNPAWVFTDLLIGEINKKAITKDRLDVNSLVEWADFCDAIPTPPPSQTFVDPRFETNFVLDYSTPLQSALNQVSGAAQASLNIVDGKYGVLVDKFKTTPVQIFTPRNSSGFSSTRFYGPRPDALKIKYVDPGSDWNVSEVVVYDNGFDENSAEEFEEMTAFACTSHEQAWRFGRYMIAQNKLRQETITLTVDFEHLVCTRGDYVQITQDVMRVGGYPARVKSVSGNMIVINDSLDIDGMLSYGYTYRAATGVIYTSTLTSTGPSNFTLAGSIPAVGDLIVIGVVGSIVYDCIVKAIAPNDDLSATITLTEKADGIYAYESTDVLPDYDPQLSPTTNPDFRPPGEVVNLAVTDSGYECAATGSGYTYFVELLWAPPNSAVELYEIYVDYGGGYNRIDTTRDSLYRYTVNTDFLGTLHRFKVLAVSASGKKLALGNVGFVSQTPVSKTTPPSDVPKLYLDITNEVLQLSWDRVADCDVKEYLIRFSPSLTATWETTIPISRIDAKTGTTTTQARTGAYLIKAVDFNGTESVNAAAAITTIPNLFNLNIVDSLSDSPTWPGTFDKVVNASGALLLDKAVPGGPGVGQYYSEGYYYYASLLDLGEIYTVRLQSSIQSEGFAEDDLMSNWTTLASVLLLSSTGVSAWGLETQYRSTDQLNVMSDWTSLDIILALNEGLSSIFTPWRTFLIGDATARIFQFRLRLISNVSSVTPRVFDGTISADMPDRIESFENLMSSAGSGYVVNYITEYYGPGTSPNVQISIDGASTGDYWAFDYKNLTGFSIRFYDKNAVQVARQFDVSVKGYGRKNLSVI